MLAVVREGASKAVGAVSKNGFSQSAELVVLVLRSGFSTVSAEPVIDSGPASVIITPELAGKAVEEGGFAVGRMMEAQVANGKIPVRSNLGGSFRGPRLNIYTEAAKARTKEATGYGDKVTERDLRPIFGIYGQIFNNFDAGDVNPETDFPILGSAKELGQFAVDTVTRGSNNVTWLDITPGYPPGYTHVTQAGGNIAGFSALEHPSLASIFDAKARFIEWDSKRRPGAEYAVRVQTLNPLALAPTTESDVDALYRFAEFLDSRPDVKMVFDEKGIYPMLGGVLSLGMMMKNTLSVTTTSHSKPPVNMPADRLGTLFVRNDNQNQMRVALNIRSSVIQRGQLELLKAAAKYFAKDLETQHPEDMAAIRHFRNVFLDAGLTVSPDPKAAMVCVGTDHIYKEFGLDSADVERILVEEHPTHTIGCLGRERLEIPGSVRFVQNPLLGAMLSARNYLRVTGLGSPSDSVEHDAALIVRALNDPELYAPHAKNVGTVFAAASPAPAMKSVG